MQKKHGSTVSGTNFKSASLMKEISNYMNTSWQSRCLPMKKKSNKPKIIFCKHFIRHFQ